MKFMFALALAVFALTGNVAASQKATLEAICFNTFAEFDAERLKKFPDSKLSATGISPGAEPSVMGLFKGTSGGWIVTAQSGPEHICVIAAGANWNDMQ